MLLVSSDVKGQRPYRSAKRAAQAAETRAAVLRAARALILENGYVPTTVAQIANGAGVNVDTLYATVGRKPDLMRAVVESAISGEDRAVPAEERGYVRAILAAESAEEKLRIYAFAVAEMAPRTAPVFEALRTAALTDRSCAALYTEITDRRAGNMRRFAADLRATGSVRDDLPDDELADIVWSMNSAEYQLLLMRDRGWSQERFGLHLAATWSRLFLAPP